MMYLTKTKTKTLYLMEASTGLPANGWYILCWASRTFELARKISHYLKAGYQIWGVFGPGENKVSFHTSGYSTQGKYMIA